MTGVDFHRVDTPAQQLQALAREIYDSDVRGRGLDYALRTARERRPDLVALDHHGLPEDPGELVDPGMILGASRAAFMAKGWNQAEAWSEACKAHPEAFAAWSGATMMPASQATEQHQAQAYRSSDPGVEIMRLTEELLAADKTLTVDSARKLVMARDPTLTAHYCEQRPLPTTPQPSRRETLVEKALLSVQAQQAEIEKLKLAAPAPVKRLHRAPMHRPIRHESELLPGEILLHIGYPFHSPNSAGLAEMPGLMMEW